MVSFVCDYCQETLKKAKLDQHAQRCRNAQFSCIDCSTTFQGTNYRAHTSCISEAEKYQKALFKGPKKGAQTDGNNQNKNGSEAKATTSTAAATPAASFTVHPVKDFKESTLAAPKSKPLIEELKKKEKASKKDAMEEDDDEKEEAESKAAGNESEFKSAILKSAQSVFKKASSSLNFKKARLRVAKRLLKQFPERELEDLKAQVDENLEFQYEDGKLILKV
ncbi:hypothetical protein HDU97_008213 [Phlyctochytrium planicorne]|nr:hypothetical protein HDU97_008213 [Phlyctochytrium planicorne]